MSRAARVVALEGYTDMNSVKGDVLHVVAAPVFSRTHATSAVARGRAIDAWRHHVRGIWGDVRVAVENTAFHGGVVRCGRLAAADISIITADPHTVVRATPGKLQGYVYLCHLLAGSMRLFQDGRVAVVGTGDLVCFDGTRPFTMSMPKQFSMLVLRVPHGRLRLRPADTVDVTARPWSGHSGFSAVVRNALSALHRNLDDLSQDAADSLGSGFISMVGLLLAGRLDRAAGDTEIGRRALLERVMDYGRQHLHHADLSPHALARRHHVSVRYLQQLFAEDGTSPARWIREERLARCYSDLCDPAKNDITVAAIGERWGLTNASHFSRQFRDRYGVSPSELRSATHAAAA